MNNCVPVPPREIPSEIMQREFGPLTKCKHGMIASICSGCSLSDRGILGNLLPKRRTHADDNASAA